MNYKYINNIQETKIDNKTILVITIPKENIDNVSIFSDYNSKTDSNNVIIKVRKNNKLLESRTILNSTLFPRHLERSKINIIIYLESFKYETTES